MSRRVLVIVLFSLVWLAGCRKAEVYSELSQSEANEMLVLLSRNNIAAELTRVSRQNETFYGVAVEHDDLDHARALLQEHNLPRQKKPGLEEVFKSSGPIPNREEQRARYLLALKGEIVNSLERIPDVIEADVLLNVPMDETFSIDQPQQKPTASVVLKVQPTEQTVATLTEEKIQRFVANAIEKLDPRDVSVIITYSGTPPSGLLPGQGVILPQAPARPATEGAAKSSEAGETVSVAGISVSVESAGRLKLYLGLFLGLLAALALGLVVMVMQASRMRQPGGHPELLAPNQAPPQLGPGA